MYTYTCNAVSQWYPLNATTIASALKLRKRDGMYQLSDECGTRTGQGLAKVLIVSISSFVSNIDGKRWIDIPFAFDKYWQDRGLKL